MKRRLTLFFLGVIAVGSLFFFFSSILAISKTDDKYEWEEKKLISQILLLKDMAINLEKFRLFGEKIYLDEIKRLNTQLTYGPDANLNAKLFRLDSIIGNTPKAGLAREGIYLVSELRELLKQKKMVFNQTIKRNQENYLSRLTGLKRRFYLSTSILIFSFLLFFGLSIVFAGRGSKKELQKLFNGWQSMLELTKLTSEKFTRFSENIGTLLKKTNELNSFIKPPPAFEEMQKMLEEYHSQIFYEQINIQLAILRNDISTLNQRLTNFKNLAEKSQKVVSELLKSIITDNKSAQVIQKNKEILNNIKDDLENFGKLMVDISHYENILSVMKKVFG